MEKNFSLHDLLTMKVTRSLNVGDIIKVEKIDSVISYADSRTGEMRKAVVVIADNGNKYYLPNSIGRKVVELFDNGDEALARYEIEGHTFRCEEFVAKRFGTKGKTLSLVE